MKEKKKWGLLSRGLQALWLLALGAVACALFWAAAHTVVTTMEAERMERIGSTAQRDAIAVQSTIADWQRSVADWANAVRSGNPTSIQDLTEATALGSQLMGSQRLYLVDKTGYYYDNTGLIAPKPEYDSLLQSMEDDGLLTLGGAGTFLVGWKLKPFTVEYNQFAYVLAEFPTAALSETLESALHTEELYYGIVDAQGNFLVDGVETGKQFFDILEGASIRGFDSARMLRNALAGNPSLEVSCKLADGDGILITTPLPELDWTLVTIQPVTSMVSLKNPILRMALLLCVLLTAAVVWGLWLLRKLQKERAQKRLAQQQGQELRQSLDTAQEANRSQTQARMELTHNMINALNSIVGYAALADRHRQSPDSVREYLGKVGEASNQILSLLEPEWTPRPQDAGMPAVETPLDLTGRRILLVEDNELNRELGAAILTEAGMIVDFAENGQVGFQKVAMSKPGSYFDLVLMDLHMPVMDGCEAASTIRRLRTKRMAEVPILALTASISPEEKQRAFQAGMDGYVEKPVDMDKLLRAIRNALSRGFAG